MRSRFDRAAAGWETGPRKKMATAIASAMIKALKPQKSDSCADIGAGTGLVSAALAKRTGRVVAYDSSRGMLNELKEKIRISGISNIMPVFLDIEKDPAPQKSFDVVVSSMAMHHVKNTPLFARKLCGMLKAGGRLAIADLEKEDGGFHGDFRNSGAKHKGFDRNRLIAIFRQAGFFGIRFKRAYSALRQGKGGKQKKYHIFLMNAKKPGPKIKAYYGVSRVKPIKIR
ncbi:MAG TPA: class I SAM-dependent methyltransferase [Candidatus Goldiibacteriota bacterium]|nr:class I SAM-dependent methyltransferase [Candidatus Goldiibacteriota bacterium]